MQDDVENFRLKNMYDYVKLNGSGWTVEKGDKDTDSGESTPKKKKQKKKKDFYKKFGGLSDKEKFQRITVDRLIQTDPLYQKPGPLNLMACFKSNGDGGNDDVKVKKSVSRSSKKSIKKKKGTIRKYCTLYLSDQQKNDLMVWGNKFYEGYPQILNDKSRRFKGKDGNENKKGGRKGKGESEIDDPIDEEQLKKDAANIIAKRKRIGMACFQVICRCAKGKSHIPTKLPDEEDEEDEDKKKFVCRTKHFSKHYSRTYTKLLKRNREAQEENLKAALSHT